jgi:hypothetical protein
VCLGGALLRLGLSTLTCAPETVGVMAVEASPMLPRIGYVAAHAGQPLEGVEGLEVASQRGVHAEAVEDGLLAVVVDELPEREWVPHEVGASVLDALLVLRSDRFAHLCAEGWVSPGEQLLDELA